MTLLALNFDYIFCSHFFWVEKHSKYCKNIRQGNERSKHASADVQNEIKKSGVDIKKDLNLKEIIKDTEDEISQPLDQVMTDVENSINYNPNKKTFVEETDQEKLKEDKNG